MNLKELPFKRVKVLCFERGSTVLKFKTSFSEENYSSVDVGPTVVIRKKSQIRNFDIPEPKLLGDSIKCISEAKKKDLTSMLKFMPLLDRQFFENLLK